MKGNADLIAFRALLPSPHQGRRAGDEGKTVDISRIFNLMNEALTPYPSPLMGRGGLNQRFPNGHDFVSPPDE